MSGFERRLFYYFENLKRQLRTQPLILGGVSVSGGGIGSPPGGFIGLLPQSKVTFDYLEDNTTNEIPVSGASLLDNLNRIRYDLANVSGGGGSSTFLGLTDVDESDYTGFAGYSVIVNAVEDGLEFSLVSGGGGSASTFLDLTDSPSDYTGYAGQSVVVNDTEDGIEFAVISGSGSSGNFSYVQEDLTSQIPAGGDNYDLQYTPVSGTLIVHYNGLTQEFSNYTVITSGVHTSWSPESGDELFVEYFYGTTEVGVTNPTITVISGATSVTGVNTLNIQGMTVTDDGGGQVTISGGTGGGGSAPTATGSYWNPDVAPTTPSAYDDEFDDESFDTGLWTIFDQPTGLTYSEEKYGFTWTNHSTSNIVQGICQEAPASTGWSVMAKISCIYKQADDAKCGLFLMQDFSTPSTSDLIYFVGTIGGAGTGVAVETWNQYNSYLSNVASISDDKWSNSFYLRIRADSSNYWHYDWSIDGIGWLEKQDWYANGSNQTRLWAPTGFGVCIRANTTAPTWIVNWFRYSTNTGYDVVHGNRINYYEA